MYQFLLGLSISLCKADLGKCLGATVPCRKGVYSLVPTKPGNIITVASNVMAVVPYRTV